MIGRGDGPGVTGGLPGPFASAAFVEVQAVELAADVGAVGLADVGNHELLQKRSRAAVVAGVRVIISWLNAMISCGSSPNPRLHPAPRPPRRCRERPRRRRSPAVRSTRNSRQHPRSEARGCSKCSPGSCSGSRRVTLARDRPRQGNTTRCSRRATGTDFRGRSPPVAVPDACVAPIQRRMWYRKYLASSALRLEKSRPVEWVTLEEESWWSSGRLYLRTGKASTTFGKMGRGRLAHRAHDARGREQGECKRTADS